jgi:hypothetical protein
MENHKSRTDKYIDIILGKAKGSAKQREIVERINYAFNLMASGQTRLFCARMIQKKYEISQAAAFMVINDAIQCYGDAFETSKKGLKYAFYEYFMKLAKKAETNGDFGTARLSANDAMKAVGLDKEDFSGLFDPADFIRPDVFIISDDPKFLDAAGKAIEVEIEDIEHEEITEDKQDVKKTD